MPESPTAAPGLIRFGIFEVDSHAEELRKNGAKVRLEGHPFQILALLLERPGQLVTREELKQKLWAADTFVDFEHSINVAVMRLREALDDSAETPRFVETLPRRGYRFIYPVDSAGAEVQLPAAWWPRHWAASLVVVVAAAVLAGVLAANLGGLRDRIFGVKPGPIHSVAVLPFKNLTGDPGQEFFADGMTDALTTELAQVRALRVISVTSAMFYKGERKKLPEIARELNVDAVVEGSVQRSGDRVWINVQLLHAPSDRHLWASTYERDIKDVPKLQSRLARDIIMETKGQLSEQEETRLARERVVNPEAYEAYLKARKIWWSKITEEGYWKSIEYYQKAIEKEPGFAEAYSGMARSYMFLRQLYPTKEMVAKARAAAMKALELDPTLAEPHALLGNMKRIERDWVEAEEKYKRALELNPNDSLAHLNYAVFLNDVGRNEEALAEIRRAEQIDPLSAFVSANVILRLNALGRHQEALEQARKALELDPNLWLTYSWMAGTYWYLKRYDEAIQAWEKALTLPGVYEHWPVSRLVGAYARVGRRDDAMKALVRLEEISKRRYVEPTRLALANAAVGRKDEAIRILQKAQQEGKLDSQPWEELAELLGDEPRFQALLRGRGVPPSHTHKRKTN